MKFFRYAQDRREAAGRQGKPDPQGSGLDAARGREEGRGGVGGVPGQALSEDASDDAPICY